MSTRDQRSRRRLFEIERQKFFNYPIYRLFHYLLLKCSVVFKPARFGFSSWQLQISNRLVSREYESSARIRLATLKGHRTDRSRIDEDELFEIRNELEGIVFAIEDNERKLGKVCWARCSFVSSLYDLRDRSMIDRFSKARERSRRSYSEKNRGTIRTSTSCIDRRSWFALKMIIRRWIRSRSMVRLDWI